jgi:hypothetical protein
MMVTVRMLVVNPCVPLRSPALNEARDRNLW